MNTNMVFQRRWYKSMCLLILNDYWIEAQQNVRFRYNTHIPLKRCLFWNNNAHVLETHAKTRFLGNRLRSNILCLLWRKFLFYLCMKFFPSLSLYLIYAERQCLHICSFVHLYSMKVSNQLNMYEYVI